MLCEKVRTGLGDMWACRAHGGPWPCEVGRQLGDQLTLLAEVAPLAEPILAEIIAERRYAITVHPQSEDDQRDALAWIDLLGAYLERLAVEAVELQHTMMLLGTSQASEVPVRRYRHRLVQTAGIAVAAVEAIDRMGVE